MKKKKHSFITFVFVRTNAALLQRRDSRSVSGMELLMEELVEVTVLMEGLMPYAGYTPVMAAVWDTQAAGSMGRMGSPGSLENNVCGEDLSF